MKNPTVRVTPLGGVGEIGKNCTVLECGDTILVIDAGLEFPDADLLGVDLVIPDFSYLIENRDRVRAIVITHGHEDHIGALPYLLQHVRAPLYATSLTHGLVEGKLRRHRLLGQVPLHPMSPGDTLDLGPFQVTPYHVNHSIPDSVGLAIRTPLGLIVHSGDFKIDHTPLDGKITDLGVLARLSAEGVILLLSDSTNAESPGYTASESQLKDTFQSVFMNAPGRVIVTTFASLLSRVQLAITTAAQVGRKVAIAGRSMEENTAIAEKLGFVSFPPETRIPLHRIDAFPPNEVCVLATGSQGEPNSALARMAAGRFRHISIQEGDTIMLSSKAIPGNETQIYRNIDNLFRRGANVVYGTRAGLHVSGHAAQEELKMLLNLLRPLYFVPVHGEYRMLQVHARLAYEMGFAREDVFVMGNGDCLELSEAGATLIDGPEIADVFVDGALVGDVGNTILRDRTTLSRDGFVVARVSVDPESGELVDEPTLISQGFVYVPESSELMQRALTSIETTVAAHINEVDDAESLEQLVKRSLEELFHDETRRRPVVIVMVTWV